MGSFNRALSTTLATFFGVFVAIVLAVVLTIYGCGMMLRKSLERADEKLHHIEDDARTQSPERTSAKTAPATPAPPRVIIVEKTVEKPVYIPEPAAQPPVEPTLGPRTQPSRETAADLETREWTVDGGRVTAKYLGIANARVLLRTEDGRTLRVEPARLGREDRQWIEARREARGK